MISNELNLFKRVWIRGMERLCIRGMDQDLKWAAAIWVPMDTLSLDMSGHTAGRPNRWLLLTGSRDRLWPPDEVMLIIIPNRAIPWTQQLGWSMALGLQHFKEAYLLPWMNVWTLRWLSISRTRNRDITKKLAGVCTVGIPCKATLRMTTCALYMYICIGFQFPVSDYSGSSVLHHLSLVAWGGNLQHVESAFIIFATSMIFYFLKCSSLRLQDPATNLLAWLGQNKGPTQITELPSERSVYCMCGLIHHPHDDNQRWRSIPIQSPFSIFEHLWTPWLGVVHAGLPTLFAPSCTAGSSLPKHLQHGLVTAGKSCGNHTIRATLKM